MVLPTVLCLVSLLLATAAAGLIRPRAALTGTAVYAVAFVVGFLLLALGAAILVNPGPPESLVLPLGLPWLGARFRLDELSALFLVVAGLGAAAASLYGLGHPSAAADRHRVLPFYPVFLGAMTLVVLADDAFTFLFAWEVMSVSSWALVLANHRDPDNRAAGYVYLIMAGFGTAALLLGFGVLAAAAGGFGFAEIRAAALPPPVAALALALILIGTGSKAGLIPLHAWLPLAHPAAPSHVSALMSGVMTKVAVYGFVRIVFDLMGEPEWWWGAVVVTLGGITAVLGVLYALMQHDLKRLLAYHTVENIGIIFIGLGLALAFRANGMAAGAALALTAALFHVFNHSVFKNLLFLGAGAVLHATGQRDMEQLGGLIHPMPRTALFFLIGSAAISALPPLNGFVSEWLLFQAVLVSNSLPEWGLRFLVPAAGALLALSAALAATCFVKAFGISFLGRPRSPAAAGAREADVPALAAMGVLAAVCLYAGVLPGFCTDALGPVVEPLAGVRLPEQRFEQWLTLVPIAAERSSYSGFLVLVFMVSCTFGAFLVTHWLGRPRVRRGAAWDCGFPDPTPAGQYTAGSFAQPIRRTFGSTVFGAHETVTMPPPGDLAPARFHVDLRDPFWDFGYLPVAAAVRGLADRLNPVQFLSVRRFLVMVFVTLVTLLGVLALWQ